MSCAAVASSPAPTASSTPCRRPSTPCAACRRTERTGERVWVSAIDPLNLAGVILPGDKQPAQAGKGTLYVDGLPQAPDASEVFSHPKPPVPSRLTPRLGVHARN